MAALGWQTGVLDAINIDGRAPNPVVRGVALGLPGSTLSGPSSRYRETAVRVDSGLDGGDAP